jgi:TPR repeat protein
MFKATKVIIIFLLSSISALSVAKPNFDPNQNSAKDEGIILYNQYKVAAPQLQIAAEAGDSEAQFYLGNEIRNSKKYITAEAFKWYKAAADQGNLYAMFQLARSSDDLCVAMNNCQTDGKTADEWFTTLIHSAKPLAENGNSEAMTIMYNSTGDIDWLKKASERNYAPAQLMLANLYQDGKEYFFIPGSRKKTVNELLKSSAENGNPKAMMEYFGELRQQGRLEEARHWLETAANTGYEKAVYSYGYFLGVDPSAIEIKEDLVKGYALIKTLKVLTGGGNVQEYVDDALPQITAKMSPEEVAKADALAEHWSKTHPPLSFFPDKLTY